MVTQTDWKEKGQRAVGAATDLATGLFKGLQNIGSRVGSAQYRPIVEAFCAWTGFMAAQHGKLQRTEIEGFRNFLLQNVQHPVFGGFPLDELIDKFRDYAIKAFLDERAVFDAVLHPIPQDSDEAKLIITGCLNVIYADGQCDENERQLLEQLAQRLAVNTEVLARRMGIILPNPVRSAPYQAAAYQATPQPYQAAPQPAPYQAAPPPPPVQTPPSPAYQVAPPPPPPSVQASPSPARPAGGVPCSLCQGKGCVFCNQTGIKG
ncbi:MAG: TerB family tellurite resistance protein [Magnetococcales bacterium]|nr:TerB family tellurite resistance protein [Magnetococcales bacterium]